MEVTNIVAVAKFCGVNFNATKSSKKSSRKRQNRRGIQKRPFNGKIIRIPNYGTCLLFPNGAVTAVGIKSLDKFIGLTKRLLDILQPCGKVTIEDPFKVCNIVSSGKIATKIDLNCFYNFLKSHHHLTYTPETFPGMRVQLKRDQNLTAVVFHSGKVITTGAQSMNDVILAQNILRNIMTSYQSYISTNQSTSRDSC